MTVAERQAPRRHRTRLGRDFEDFVVGDVYEHRPGRTITEVDNTWFTLLTMNNHPAHFDVAYAAHTEFKKPLVNSTLTLAIVAGMSVTETSYRAIGNLGWKEVRLSNPVFAGDTLYAESEVLDKRLSKSRPGQGIVTIRTTGTKADGTVVITFERSFLIATAKAAVHASANY